MEPSSEEKKDTASFSTQVGKAKDSIGHLCGELKSFIFYNPSDGTFLRKYITSFKHKASDTLEIPSKAIINIESQTKKLQEAR